MSPTDAQWQVLENKIDEALTVVVGRMKKTREDAEAIELRKLSLSDSVVERFRDLCRAAVAQAQTRVPIGYAADAELGEQELFALDDEDDLAELEDFRLCGLAREMTEEHIPPKSAFNKGRFKNVRFEDWLEEGPKEHEFRAQPGSPIRQGGIRAYTTLCSVQQLRRHPVRRRSVPRRCSPNFHHLARWTRNSRQRESPSSSSM